MKNPFTESLELIAKKYDCDIFLFKGHIGLGADDQFIATIEKRENKKESVILFLETYGGIPDIAYRMARFLRSSYKNVYYAIGGVCKSSGTLMALSANRIIMGFRGELGPLDIQIAKKDEPGEKASGLNIFQALEFLEEQSRAIMANTYVDLRNGAGLSTKQAFDVAERLASKSMAPIYAQIEPVRLGEFRRAMQIAEKYGTKLDCGNLKPGALRSLISDYPSHGHVIDREECKELFNVIENAGIEFECIMSIMRKNLEHTSVYCDDLIATHLENNQDEDKDDGDDHVDKSDESEVEPENEGQQRGDETANEGSPGEESPDP